MATRISKVKAIMLLISKVSSKEVELDSLSNEHLEAILSSLYSYKYEVTDGQ